MNPDDHRTKFNFNSNQPTGNGIFGSPAANTANGRPATTLNVSVLSPTHFDQPAQPTQPTPPPSPEELAKQALEKSAKRNKILAIIFGSFSFIFLCLGIVGLVMTISANNLLNETRSLASSQSLIIAALKETTGIEIATPEDVPTYQTPHGYIYLDEWGIKLRVPEDLVSVSYIYDQKYRPSICFNGLKKGIQSFPAFADVAQNPGGMGCLRRVEVTEGDSDQSGQSFGTRVFTDNHGYNYFYVAPSRTFATEAAEQGLEQTSVQVIKNMLSGNNISLY